MAKIILMSDNIPYDLYALEKYGLGGSESAMINLAFSLQKRGHEVYVYAGVEESLDFIPSHKYKGVVFHDIKSKLIDLECDLFIGLRSCILFLKNDLSKAKKKIFWSQDTRYHASTEHLFSNTQDILRNIDNIVVLSEYSERQFVQDGLVEINNKVIKIQNGYNSNFLVTPIKSNTKVHCIYASTPYRGLIYLLDMWPKINEAVPNAHLHLYTGMQLYQQHGKDDINAYIYNRAKRYENITLYNPVCQKDISQIFSKMDIYLYPNDYAEAGCMALKESMANHCTSVTTQLGALNEKVIDSQNGYLIKGHPGDDEYQKEFISKSIDLMKNKNKLREFQIKAFEQVKDWTWDSRAKEWEKLL